MIREVIETERCEGLITRETQPRRCKHAAKYMIVWKPNYNQVEQLCQVHYNKVKPQLEADKRWLVEVFVKD
jgi:hypothetical protein